MGYTKTRQAINYDLSRKELEDKVGISKAIQLSSDLTNYFLERGFEKVGESAFTSIKPMTHAKVQDIVAEIHKSIDNAEDAFKSFHITSVKTNVYDFTAFAKDHPSNIDSSDLESNYGIIINPLNKSRRSIRFDIPEEKFKEKNPDKSYQNSYRQIGSTLKSMGYKNSQNSVYLSVAPKTDEEVLEDIKTLTIKYPEYSEVFSILQVSSVTRSHDATDIANKGFNISLSSSLKKEEENTADHKSLTLSEAKRMREEKELQEWKEKNHKTVDKHKNDSNELDL